MHASKDSWYRWHPISVQPLFKHPETNSFPSFASCIMPYPPFLAGNQWLCPPDWRRCSWNPAMWRGSWVSGCRKSVFVYLCITHMKDSVKICESMWKCHHYMMLRKWASQRTPQNLPPSLTEVSEVSEASEVRIPNETHADEAGGNLTPKQPEAQAEQAADERRQEPCGSDSGGMLCRVIWV
jgi:hypothetical protein